MNSVERVKAYCKSKKIAISTLEKALGYSNGYIGKLKKGVFPDDRLVEIATFLGVSIDYILGRTDDPAQTLSAYERVRLEIDGLEHNFQNYKPLSGPISIEDLPGYKGPAQKEKPTLPEEGEPFKGYSDLTDDEKEKVKEYAAFLLASRRKQ